DYADAHYNLGVALMQLGPASTGKAVEELNQTLRLKPDNADAQIRLAWLLATSADASLRNGPRAVELAEAANKLAGGNDAAVLGTLAAAYAEAARLGEAGQAAERALGLATAQTNTALAADLRTQLGYYRLGAPFRGLARTNAPLSPDH